MMTETPFGSAAADYLSKGWYPMPVVRAGEKSPIPKGYTGRDGALVTQREMVTWHAAYGAGGYNIAIRVPVNVIGIDVDDYGDKPGAATLAAWEAEVGQPLPLTWVSSARLVSRPASGIRFFLLPDGWTTEGWAGGAPGIEFIRHTHRYAVVAPSSNPDAGGDRYEWMNQLTGVIQQEPPAVPVLTVLPVEWCEFLASLRAEADDAEAAPLPPSDGEACGAIKQAVEEAVRKILNGDSRHDSIYAAVKAVYKFARQGHNGHEEALRILRSQLTRRRIEDGEDERTVNAEWSRMVDGAQALVADMPQDDECFCFNDALQAWIHGTPPPSDEQPAPEQNTERVSRLKSGKDVIANTRIPWLVEGVLHEEGIGQLTAPEHSGKTVVVVDLALSLANGLEEWAGYKLNRSGPVLYIAMEGGPIIQMYIDAWLAAHPGCSLDNFYILDQEEFDLSDKASIAQLEEDMRLAGVEKPVLVVWDTQIDVTGEVDEMLPEMGKLMSDARQWVVKRGCFGLFLHHPPYGAKRGRGSRSVRGKCDVLAYAEVDERTEIGEIEWQKVKGSGKVPTLAYWIRPLAGHAGPEVHYRPPGSSASVSEVAESPVGEAALAALEKNRLTKAHVLDVLSSGEGMSQAAICRALTTRAEEGYEIHKHKTYVAPLLAELRAEGQIHDANRSSSTGKAQSLVIGPDTGL